MDIPAYYLNTFPAFIGYFAVSIALIAVFLVIYVRVTPYREFALIKQGNVAAAVALSGSLIGFILPISAVIKSSVSIFDLIIWGGIALIVQILAFVVINFTFPYIKTHIVDGQISGAVLLSVLTLAIGIINAACLSY